MLRRARRFLSLKPGDRWLLVRALGWLAVADAALRVLGFRRLLRRYPPAASASSITPGAMLRARRYARALEIASRHSLTPARCLQRALVLHAWLRREGLPSELRIGVRRDDGRLRAHAWVDLGTECVTDAPGQLARFQRLTSTANPALTDTTSGPSGCAERGSEGTYARTR